MTYCNIRILKRMFFSVYFNLKNVAVNPGYSRCVLCRQSPQAVCYQFNMYYRITVKKE